MRKKTLWLAGLLVLLVAVMLVGVTAQASTAAPIEPGPPQGMAAASAAGTCGDCHNSGSQIKARELQYEESVHAMGEAFNRNQADCSFCHTSQGFSERMAKNTTAVGVIQNPTPIDCRACHNIHETYTGSDWALTSTKPVQLLLTKETIDLGKGNLCANCHQPRTSYPVPTVGGGEVKVTSSRYGPHNGPQATMLTGKAGYGEFKGFSAHSVVKDGCVTCHMATPNGAWAGGHSMNIAFESEGAKAFNTAGCQQCHAGLTNVNHNGKQALIKTMTLEVKNLLIAKKLLDANTGMVVPGTYSSQIAGAIWNYRTVEADKSGGVHNPAYAMFLLQTAKDAVK